MSFLYEIYLLAYLLSQKYMAMPWLASAKSIKKKKAKLGTKDRFIVPARLGSIDTQIPYYTFLQETRIR